MNNIRQNQTSSMSEIFINFLSFILLGIVAASVGILYFQIINKYFPDVLSTTYQNYRASSYNPSVINYSIASLFIGFPIFLWAMWFWFKSFRNFPEKIESKLSKWLTYIVLLIAGGTIIGDLITVIYNFLQGEYGARFLMKALTILVIAGLVFCFYFLERKKIQYKKEISSGLFWFVGGAAGFLAILAIVLGFIAGGTPFEARLRTFDKARTQDLQGLSSCIGNFAYDNKRLPRDLSELKNNARYSYCAVRISDPETNKNYKYSIISQDKFELCGEFALSNLDEFMNIDYYGKWEKHDKGQLCEEQTVTFFEERSLPLEKTAPLPAR